MTKLRLHRSLIAVAIAGTTFSAASAQDVTLNIESWRNDDLKIWQDSIIPAFEASHPGIKVNFNPFAPAEYNAILNSKLEAGSWKRWGSDHLPPI